MGVCVRSLALALALTACGSYDFDRAPLDHPIEMPPLHIAERLDFERVLSSAIAHWDDVIGSRKPVPVVFASMSPHVGWCARNVTTGRSIQIDVFDISSPEVLRAIFLHELAHAHLECSGSDHVSDPSSTMSPRPTAQFLDPLTAHRIRSRL
jgi:hypothetical protein